MLRTFALWGVAAMVGMGCGHSQSARPTGQVPEQRIYIISENARDVGGSGGVDCDAEHIECFDRCWNAPERPYPHVKRDEWYCATLCLKEYMECVKKQEEAATEAHAKLGFQDMDNALSWLRSHQEELVLGTIVVVAGVAFVVATGGAGALLLVPLAL